MAKFSALGGAEMLIAGGACVCFFLFGSIAGGAYLWFRLRRQNAENIPAPTPPPVTRDAHAAPDTASPSLNIQPIDETAARPRSTATPDPIPSADDNIREQIEEAPQEEPPPAPDRPSSEREIIDEATTIRGGPPDDDDTNIRTSRPLGMDDPIPDTMDPTAPLRENEPFTPLVLPDDDELETPTIIIDRSKPMPDEDDE